MKTIKPVEIVQIQKLVPIFKDGQEAQSIQVVNFAFDDGSECAFDLIAQKGLYNIGSSAVYIQPDYCLPIDKELFYSFTQPFGDPKKSKLGKEGRIRAVKFNFQFENGQGPVWSNGILLPIAEVETFLGIQITPQTDLVSLLGITKYEEPESAGSGLVKGGLPDFLYATDETNQANLKSHIEKIITDKEELVISTKIDGSSFTMYVKKNREDWIYGVCSRGQEKKLEQRLVTEWKKEDAIYTKWQEPETGTMGWKCKENDHFVVNSIPNEKDGWIKKTKEVKDSWIELAKSSGLLEKGVNFCKENNLELAFRGEIYGQGLKGSGNNLNPHSKLKQGLILFGIDDLSRGHATRINWSNEWNLETICKKLNLDWCQPIVELVPLSYNNLSEICQSIFDDYKSKGQIIEGVVIRTKNSNNLSCKWMNPEYDSKK